MRCRALVPRSPILGTALLTLCMVPHGCVEQGPAAASTLHPSSLRCEYRVDPLGIDVVHPRLSWVLESDERGQAQTGYRILVATSVDKLSPADADLWDSGRVGSDQTIHVTYDGKPLTSRRRCYWTVRVWDKDGAPSAWSEPAVWSMGLLSSSDWGARWISLDRGSEQTRSQDGDPGPLRIGYASEVADSPDQEKWVAMDLGAAHSIDAVQLHPARRFLRTFGPLAFINYDVGYLFPKRFVVEVANRPDFSDAKVIVDRTDEDTPNPGTEAPLYRCEPIEGRYVRLRTTTLRTYAARIQGVQLAELRVFSGDRNVAEGGQVTALDSAETPEHSTRYLVDGRLESDDPIPRRPAVLARKAFRVDAPVERASVYVTALGLYELHINGRRVGDQLLAPEWTSYDKRVQYGTYDVTDLLRRGNNAIGAVLGEGWYAGRVLTRPGIPDEEPRLLLRLEIERSTLR